MKTLPAATRLTLVWAVLISIHFPITAFASGATRLAPVALGQDGRITLTPTFTPDGKTIFFAQSECSPIWECPQRLKRAELGPDGWSAPTLVSLPQSGRVDWPSVSPDGRVLLFSWAVERERHTGKDVVEDFDLYSLALGDPDALPVPLDEPDINRIRGGKLKGLRYLNNETAPSVTRSGDLYFWTERLDGLGERDVYVAASDGQGGFLAPTLLPSPINSDGRDNGAWIAPAGDLLLLSYSDRGGQGGADIFVARKRGADWTRPVNLGPAVNSSYNDFSAQLSPDGAALVFTSDRPVPGRTERVLQVWTVPVDEVGPLGSSPEPHED